MKTWPWCVYVNIYYPRVQVVLSIVETCVWVCSKVLSGVCRHSLFRHRIISENYFSLVLSKCWLWLIPCFSSAPCAECSSSGVHGGAGPACQPGVWGWWAAPAWSDLAQGEEACGGQRSHTYLCQWNLGNCLGPAQWRRPVHMYCQKSRRQSQPRHKAGHSRWV